MPDASQPAVSLVVIWTTPQDTAAFDRDYTQRHVPLVWQLPGLIEARTWTLRSPTHHRMTELRFAGRDELKAALGSQAGRALADDAQRLEKAFSVTADSHIATAEPSAGPG